MGVFSSVFEAKDRTLYGKRIQLRCHFPYTRSPLLLYPKSKPFCAESAVNQDTNTIIAFCIDLVLTVTTKDSQCSLYSFPLFFIEHRNVLNHRNFFDFVHPSLPCFKEEVVGNSEEFADLRKQLLRKVVRTARVYLFH